jgi:hypothetical protein
VGNAPPRMLDGSEALFDLCVGDFGRAYHGLTIPSRA